MKKIEVAMNKLYRRMPSEYAFCQSRDFIENIIREMADKDEDFYDEIFEIGCKRLAKKFIKSMR